MKNITLDDFTRIFQNRKAGVLGSYGYFSVLVPLVEKEGELHILYEVRADHLKRQPGEICFPGGKLEKNETPEACAIRETCEELNIDEKNVKVIAKLDYMLTYSNFTMYSYLGIIDYNVIKNSEINKDEVKEIFLVPVSYLMKNEPYIYEFDVIPNVGKDFPYEMIQSEKGYNWRKGKSIVPIYNFENHVIWGLTGRITYNLMQILKNNK